MVVLGVAVYNYSGKLLLSRQFVAIEESRIKSYLEQFPELLKDSKKDQHTFVDSANVRHLYFMHNKLCLTMLTTKVSNILQDMNTFKLFKNILRYHVPSGTKAEVFDNSFELIFAFDEVISLGYPECQNFSELMITLEMESDEERLQRSIRKQQERCATMEMVRRSTIINQKRERNGKPLALSKYEHQPGCPSHSPRKGRKSKLSEADRTSPAETDLSAALNREQRNISSTKNSLKLGSKCGIFDAEAFLNKLKLEGTSVDSPLFVTSECIEYSKSGVHLNIEEQISVELGRFVGEFIRPLEILGTLTLQIHDSTHEKLSVIVSDRELCENFSFQIHPNMNKDMFKEKSVLQLKNPSKSLPVNIPLEILKWRLESSDPALLPIIATSWPNKTSTGYDVTVEYELQSENLELIDVIFTIKLPPNSKLAMDTWSGEYKWNPSGGVLTWSHQIIDRSCKDSSMNFSIETKVKSLQSIPLSISFKSNRPFIPLRVDRILDTSSDEEVDFSRETTLSTKNYCVG